MIIERKSMLSGIVRQRDINVTADQLARWQSGELIQNVMPEVSLSDREFIITGVTDDEWEQMNLCEDCQ
jgi:hypothetical protein